MPTGINRELIEKIKAKPKAELHRHLEGCVRIPTIIRLARKYKLPLPSFDEKELEKTAKLHGPMSSLGEVLKMFSLAQSVFCSYQALEEITLEVLQDAYEKENIKLLELRFSPDFMLGGKELNWNKSLEILTETVKKFERKNSFLAGIIVIASRSRGLSSALKTIDFAVENRKKIIGFDFADNEKEYPSRLYSAAVKKLHFVGLPLTVHSGEEGEYSQIEETVKELNPRRIGHGVKAAEDPTGAVMCLLKEKNITLETNPFSNYLTGAVKSIETHPLKKFINAGLKVSISADDPEILNTNLNKEYMLCLEKAGLSIDDLDYAGECALEASFLEKDKKQEAEKLLNPS